MRIEEMLMHLRAGEFYGAENTCNSNGKPKMRYATEDVALRSSAAMSAKYNKDMEHYPCVFCHEWHIGRRMTEDERKQFVPVEGMFLFLPRINPADDTS